MSEPVIRIGGLAPFSTVDWPGHLAATIFTDGCPWDCAYCHNPHLLCGGSPHGPTWAEVIEFLGRRVGLLDGVVFSGGEPLAQHDLAKAVAQVRDLGFEVGLHTNGAYPQKLDAILPLVSWVGIDIKAPFESYDSVTGGTRSGDLALRSLRAVIASGVDYEVRTTVHSSLIDVAALHRLALELAAVGVCRWVLQPYRTLGVRPGLPPSTALAVADIESIEATFGHPLEVR